MGARMCVASLSPIAHMLNTLADSHSDQERICRALRWKCKTQASEAKGYELLCLAAEQLRGAKKAPFTVECTISEVKARHSFLPPCGYTHLQLSPAMHSSGISWASIYEVAACRHLQTSTNAKPSCREEAAASLSRSCLRYIFLTDGT